MKKIILVALLCVVSVCAFAQSNETKIFNDNYGDYSIVGTANSSSFCLEVKINVYDFCLILLFPREIPNANVMLETMRQTFTQSIFAGYTADYMYGMMYGMYDEMYRTHSARGLSEYTLSNYVNTGDENEFGYYESMFIDFGVIFEE